MGGVVVPPSSDEDDDPPQPPKQTKVVKDKTNPQSTVKGVVWNKKTQKWHGVVHDVLADRCKSGNAKQLTTGVFDKEEDAIEAHAKLKAKVEERYRTTTAQWVEEDPLTRGLPLGPKDAAEAEVGTVYWRPNERNNHRPHRVVRVSAGKQRIKWIRACDLCQGMADVNVKEVHFCIAHMPMEHRCPHGGKGQKYLCTICNPKSIHFSNKCSQCKDQIIQGKQLLSKGGTGRCASCDKDLAKQAAVAGTTPPPKGERWETVCMKKLLPLVDAGYEMQDDQKYMLGALIQDSKGKKRKTRGDDPNAVCDTTSRRRPDLLYVLRCPHTARIVTVIDVEIDEFSHKDRLTECEMGRVDDLYQAICKLAQSEGGRGAAHPDAVAPVFYVLRLNPNDCDGKPRVGQDARIQLLADRINALADPAKRLTIDDLRLDPPPSTPIVETLFYHSNDAAHHLAAFEKAGAEGVWQWRGNTTRL